MTLYNRLIVFAIALSMGFVSSLQAAQYLFTPTLTISEEYTDNTDLDYQNEQDDYITTVGLDLNNEITWRTAGLSLRYNPSYSNYTNRSDYDSWRHLAALRMWKVLKQNTRIELSDTYLRSNDPDDGTDTIDYDTISVDQLPRLVNDINRRGRREYYENDTQISLSHQFGSDDTFDLSYQYSILRDVDISPGSVNDNDIATTSAGLRYGFTPKWAVQLNGSYAVSNYVNANDRDEYNGQIRLFHNFTRTFSAFIAYEHTVLDYEQDTDEDYKIYRPSIGITMAFSENSGLTVGAGYYTQDFKTSEDQEGFNVDSSVFKRWLYQSGSIGIIGSSGYEIDDDGIQDNGLTIFYEARVIADYRLTSRLSSNFHCSYRYSDFPSDTPDRVDQTTGFGAGLNWQALRWMQISLSYDFSNVNSDDPLNEYTENRGLIRITMAPHTPYRLN